MQLRAARRPNDSRTSHCYILAENLMFRQLSKRLAEGDVGEGAVDQLQLARAGIEKRILMFEQHGFAVDDDFGVLRNCDDHFARFEQTWPCDVGHDT